jgi:hypothetical protein
LAARIPTVEIVLQPKIKRGVNQGRCTLPFRDVSGEIKANNLITVFYDVFLVGKLIFEMVI